MRKTKKDFPTQIFCSWVFLDPKQRLLVPSKAAKDHRAPGRKNLVARYKLVNAFEVEAK